MKKRDIALAITGGLGAAVAVKMLTRAKTVVWDDVAELVPHSDHSHFVNVEGARLHYQEFGERAKPSLILLHGFTASLFVWHKVAPLLADAGFHVIAVDLVGFGYSEKPRWFDYSIPSQARIVSRFMNTLGQSGYFLSGDYANLIERWQRVEYLPMRFESAAIDAGARGSLRLEP